MLKAITPRRMDEDFEVWLFKDAPQWMQIETVGKLPDLLDAIVKRTQDTTKKLRSKTRRGAQTGRGLGPSCYEPQQDAQVGARRSV